MASNWICRLCVLLVPLLLAASVAMHPVHATDVGVGPTVVAAHGVPPEGDCGGDGSGNVLSPISCSAVNCNTATTIQDASASIEMLLVERGVSITASAMTGHIDPPDPYPPRLRILS